MTISDRRQQLLEGRSSVVEIVKQYLAQIAQHQAINAFIEVFEQEALEVAAKLDQKIANQPEGDIGRLAGAIIGLKDNICYKDHQCSAGSKILEHFTSLYSATAVERLIQEDAIIIGRLNLDEFGMGSSNENSYYDKVLNPHDSTRVPGGSSGGAAAAVALDMCTAAIGSDTGGSIRQPAAFCGVVGLKPTYGRVSRHGLIAYASSFDCISPIGQNVPDVALLLEVMAGEDAFDSTVSTTAVPSYSALLNQDLGKDLTFGVLSETLEYEGLDTEIRANILQTIDTLKAAHFQVNTLSLPLLDFIIPTYYTLVSSEASSNLSRFDGVRYGHRSEEASDLNELITKSRSEGFGPEVKRRIMLGTFLLSQGYYDQYYTKAQKVRRLIKDSLNTLLEQNDILILPTAPTVAFAFDANRSPVDMYFEDIYTVMANLAGIPAISIPIGKNAEGLPIGMQLMTKRFNEAQLLQVSRFIV